MALLNTLPSGSIITLGKDAWVLLNPSTGYLYNRDGIGFIAFDTDNDKSAVDISDSSNIGYYLNNTFLNKFSSDIKNALISKSWSGISNSAKIALISKSEWQTYSKKYAGSSGILDNPGAVSWVRDAGTVSSNSIPLPAHIDASGNWVGSSTGIPPSYTSALVRPVLFLNPNTNIVNGVPVFNAVPKISITSPSDARTLYENDSLSIAGNVTDTNVGDVVSIKFSINGGAARAITAIVSNGSATSFAKNLTYKAGKLFDGNTAITDTLAEGSQHSVKIWAEDDKGGKSSEITRTFYVVPNRAATLTLDVFVTRTGLINTDVINVAGNVIELDNGNVIVRYKIGNGAFVQVLNQVVGATPTPFNFNVLVGDLADGDNQLTIQAVDAYNAITQQVLNIRKSKNEVPLLEAVTYYEITPPNGTADGLQLYVEREVGDLVVTADIFMGAPGASEIFVPMPLASTANLTNGNAEDTFAYEHNADASKIIVRIKMTRASAASNKAIKKISGVLT